MKLNGIHHITCITADAPGNVDFYTRVLGLRMVKKSVNQDVPTIYHLFYSDQEGSPGADITFFEYPDAPRGRVGAGQVHLIVWRVGSADALDFWERRLEAEGVTTHRTPEGLRFSDPEGLSFELRVVDVPDEPLTARHPDIPTEHALQGFDGVRALTADPGRSRALVENALGFEPGDERYDVRGPSRGSWYAYDSTDRRGVEGAGSVHHVAWACGSDEEQAEWRRLVADAGANVTPIIDRFYFKSIYFREPSGVLFEIATPEPGFAADEDPEHLGERLSLPPDYEHLREELERTLTPLS